MGTVSEQEQNREWKGKMGSADQVAHARSAEVLYGDGAIEVRLPTMESADFTLPPGTILDRSAFASSFCEVVRIHPNLPEWLLALHNHPPALRHETLLRVVDIFRAELPDPIAAEVIFTLAEQPELFSETVDRLARKGRKQVTGSPILPRSF